MQTDLHIVLCYLQITASTSRGSGSPTISDIVNIPQGSKHFLGLLVFYCIKYLHA